MESWLLGVLWNVYELCERMAIWGYVVETCTRSVMISFSAAFGWRGQKLEPM